MALIVQTQVLLTFAACLCSVNGLLQSLLAASKNSYPTLPPPLPNNNNYYGQNGVGGIRGSESSYSSSKSQGFGYSQSTGAGSNLISGGYGGSGGYGLSSGYGASGGYGPTYSTELGAYQQPYKFQRPRQYVSSSLYGSNPCSVNMGAGYGSGSGLTSGYYPDVTGYGQSVSSGYASGSSSLHGFGSSSGFGSGMGSNYGSGINSGFAPVNSYNKYGMNTGFGGGSSSIYTPGSNYGFGQGHSYGPGNYGFSSEGMYSPGMSTGFGSGKSSYGFGAGSSSNYFNGGGFQSVYPTQTSYGAGYGLNSYNPCIPRICAPAYADLYSNPPKSYEVPIQGLPSRVGPSTNNFMGKGLSTNELDEIIARGNFASEQPDDKAAETEGPKVEDKTKKSKTKGAEEVTETAVL